MCGIAGIINKNGIESGQLQKMSEVLRHRGPDDEGYVMISLEGSYTFLRGRDTIPELSGIPNIKEKLSDQVIGMVHRRLSIIDLTATGHQPMTYQNDQLLIVFNGEIYNYKEIRHELKNKGYKFTSESDTEVIMASYIEWGELCVNRFIGMWSFALYDKRKGELFLSRDRFGIKPLYFVHKDNKFAFASEIKALLALDFVEAKANINAVIEFLAFGNTSDPSGNLFAEIEVVPEGCSLLVDIKNGSKKLSRYYDLEKATEGKLFNSESEAIEEFRSIFQNTVQLHIRSDVPVGVNLSGGLDSSSLTAFMAMELGGKPFNTFTAAFHQVDLDESGFAKLVTGRYPSIIPHYTYPDIHVFWDELDKQIWHHDLPFHSTSMFAQWEVMKLAHNNNIKVLLNGQGADEMLGGYYNFAGIYILDLIKQLKLVKAVHEYNSIKKNYTKNINSAISRALYAFLPEYLKTIARKNQRIGMQFISQDYQPYISKIKPPELYGKDYRSLSINAVKNGLQQLLRYEDRLSMAFSIESRVPFLDHRLVEYSIALDSSLKLKDGWTKYILRKSSEPFLPKDIIWRKDKMGFLTPANQWKNELNKELIAYLENEKFLPLFDKNKIIEVCNKDLHHPTHISEFWKMIALLKWSNVFNVTIN